MKTTAVRQTDGTQYGWVILCPACDERHVLRDWVFNGDTMRPTFSPSVLVRGVQKITDEEHAIVMAGGRIEPRPLVCHSFIVDGRIQYLGDCTHAMAGQTVDLPEVTE